MAEYIERDMAISECLKYNYAGQSDKWATKCLLKSIPTADVVAVVRCKDCKHGVWDEDEELWKCVVCAEWSEESEYWFGFVAYHDADYFCREGERRGEDAAMVCKDVETEG